MKHSIIKDVIKAIAAAAFFAFLQPFHEGMANNQPPVAITCDPPVATVTGQSANSVSFAWGGLGGATEYRIWYVRQQDNYTSGTITTNNTNFTYSNLPPGTYRFYFATVCGLSTSGSYVIEELVII